MKTKLACLFTCFLLFCCPILLAGENEPVRSEHFEFSAPNIRLAGTLTLPDSFSSATKIAILVAPPQAADRDYHGMFSSLAAALAKKGIASLRFDNRSYTDTTRIADEETVTASDQAADTHAAFLALRQNERFAGNPIGLIGHSEGGNAAAIEAAGNKGIAFVAVLSAIGIKGSDFTYWQLSLPYHYLTGIPPEKRNRQTADLYHIIELIGTCQTRKRIEEELRAYLMKTDSVQPENEPARTDARLEKICRDAVRVWLKPRQIALIQYDPEIYYSQITCPLLAMCGMTDGVVDCQTNLNGIEKILIRSGKTNYEIVALPDTDHAYRFSTATLPPFVSVSRAPGRQLPPYEEKAWIRLSDWIRKIE